MMFSQYSYFKANQPASVNKILRTSGISHMNSLVNSVKTIKYPALIVEDAPDLNLDLQDKDFEEQQHTFYILNYAAAGDDDKREAAYQTALSIGKQLFNNMSLPDRTNIDKSNIHVFKVGPMGDHAYGYGFSYEVTEE